MRMYRLKAMLVVLVGTVALVGCTTDENEEGMKLSLVTVADQTLARGETNQIAITVMRSNFKDAVEVVFHNLPSGVEVIEKGKIPADDNMRNFTLHAANNADLVEGHRAEVVVRGPDNLKTSQVFQITVKE